MTAAHAQFFRRGPSDEQLRQMQEAQRQGGMYIPTPEEAKQLQRDAAEMQTLMTEMQRLQRLGRFDEAQVLAKRLDELMNSGPMARMREQQQSRRLNDAMRQALPPGTLPEGVELEDLDRFSRGFSISESLGMERRLMEGEGAYIPEPLFVTPVILRFADDFMGNAVRMPMEARRLIIDGYGLMAAKDYEGADAALKKAASLSDSPQIAEARARLEVARGNPRNALRLLAGGPQTVQSLWEQQYVHGALGDRRAAAQAAERALKLAKPGGAEQASALNNLGVALYEAGEPRRALELYEKSVAAFQQVAGNPSPQVSGIAKTHIPMVAANLGLAFWQAGELAKAADAFRVALEERAFYENAGDVFTTERVQMAKAQAVAVELHALVTLERAAGTSSLGLQTLLERKGALLERRTRSQLAFRRDAATQVDQPGVIGRLFESPPTRVEREQAMARREEDKDLLREYDAVVAERAALPRSAANLKRIEQLDSRIQVMQQRMQMREAELKNRESIESQQAEASEIARKAGNDPAKIMQMYQARSDQQQRDREQAAKDARASLLPRVQERIPQGAVLLEMVKYRPTDPRNPKQGAERYGTYIIKPGSEPEYVDLGEAAPLDKLVGEFRASLSTPERLAFRDLGRRLDEVLMRPVRGKLGGATTLYVAPEGSLNLVPLGALIDEKGAFLLERYTINYLASGRDLLYLGRGEAARAPSLIIADPAFDQTPSTVVPAQAGTQQFRSRDFRSTRYERLPGTADEAQTLKKVLPDAAVLTGTAATETAAKKVSGPRILHIATHGFFLEDLPGESEDPMLRSGLVFAGVNALRSADDDGVLTALEASNLDLRGTKLVVLSACETGLGEVRNGEGVFGLRRAFVVAGAETLLMSLWQVADDATKDLMTSYYARLAKGEQRSDALRQAQLALLKDEKTRHPFFWAAFISSGESGNLK